MAARRKRASKASREIEKSIKRPGAFTAKAKKRGLTPAQFQKKVLANTSKFDLTTVRQASRRKSLVKINRRRYGK